LAHGFTSEPRAHDPAARAAAAAAVLEALGGAVSVECSGDEVHLRGRSCPLAVVVREHPDVCRLVEALLEEVTGADVSEHCERAGEPHCNFDLTAD
jgi:predicted ArsR family transcriptional regulator